ncbi:MAG: hypothetical protein KBC41_00490 [Candidatus Pacebacteria bacterium]|nr:hypothetical protein [Candidatus Paceibacterota bacterium]MBP9866543.1 hypothetical protein [Candidatus Paceibacterota bacterium]
MITTIKLIQVFVLFFVSSVFIFYGIIWLRNSIRSNKDYDFKNDVKRTFLKPHWKYSSFLNDNNTGRIAPIVIIIGGFSILIIGLMKSF